MRPLLRKVFGLSHLRPGQDDVIRHIMAGHDTLALMATGAGKSLCYQLPALMLPGCTLVISPLIALMKDQCDKLRAMGVAAVQLNSGLLAIEREKAEEAVREGRAKVIMTTPEHLHEPDFMRDLARHPVNLLVIDEAHCIAEWGHDFRPAFLEIGRAHAQLGKPVVLALTATATEAAIQEVMQQLDLPDMQVINTGLYRPNLHHAVDHVTSDDSKVARLLTLVKAQEGQGIVYTSTVKAAEEVHTLLTQAGEAVVLYHGHLAAGRRRDSQEAYMQGQARIMVATQAFGMGVDKADTRFVIHYQLPASLETYYQEAGRAGRDGQAADCILLYLPRDRAIQQFFLSGRYPGVDDLMAVHALLASPPLHDTGWTLATVANACERSRTKVQLAVLLMRKQGVVAQGRTGRLRLKKMQMDVPDAQALLESYVARKAQDRAMLEAMVFYAQSGQCRWKLLLQHFDQDEGFERCGHCDNCLRMAQAQADVAALAQARPPQAPPEAPASCAEAAPPQVGDAVTVPRYGRGRVLAIDSLGITVAFPNGPDRSFLPRYVRAVPARRRAPRGGE
ncbi:MAG: RecQ family ATP-dependent DNA helicase [Aquabacterium sp.]